MSTRRGLAAVVTVSVALLAGCTADGDGSTDAAEPAGTQTATQPVAADGDTAGTASSGPGTASAADAVMAEQTLATPHGGGDAHGGEVTVTLRSVEVAGGTMTVRWALTWSDEDAPADAGINYYDMGLAPVATVTDRENLKAYRPFCTEGAWQPDTESVGDRAAAQSRCQATMLVSPLENVFFKFPNHGTVEAWAVLPAPEGRPETVDVAPAEGLPLFTGATVTYLDEE